LVVISVVAVDSCSVEVCPAMYARVVVGEDD